MYKAVTVAGYVIQYSILKGKPVDNFMLNAILYFLQAEFMVSKGVQCFEETINAWNFGPIVKEVFDKNKKYGLRPINDPVFTYVDFEISEDDKESIIDIIKATWKYSTFELLKIIRRQSPWMEARIFGDSRIISPQSLYAFFND